MQGGNQGCEVGGPSVQEYVPQLDVGKQNLQQGESLWYFALVNEPPDAPFISRRLLLLLLLAFCVRLGWGLSRSSDAAVIEQLPDQREYLELSDNLLHGRGLHFYDPRFGADVYAYRTPGYPLFLAACGSSPRIARLAQALVDTSTVLAVYLLSRRWLTAGQSLFAAMLVAVNPFLIYFSGLILSETLFTAMLTWGMVLLAGTMRDGERGLMPQAFLGGLVLALAILVRPSGIGLPILLGISAAILNRDDRGAYSSWWRLPPATSMLLLTLLVMAPWAYRNYHILGRWIWTTTNGGITAYDGFNDDATGASDQRMIARLPGATQATELQRDEFFAAEASHWLKTHPRRVVELAIAKILRTWSPVPLSAEYGRSFYRWIGGLYAVPLDLLVVVGLCFGWIPRSAKCYLLIPAIYITAIHAMSVGSLRYRLPAEPMLAVLAAGSLRYAAGRVEVWRRATVVDPS